MNEIEAFAAARNKRLAAADADLHPIVTAALSNFGTDGWDSDLIDSASVLWLETYNGIKRGSGDAAMADFQSLLRKSLAKTGAPTDPPASSQVDRITHWLSSYAINNATAAGGEAIGAGSKRWITMNDDKVRKLHVELDGETVGIKEAFDVDGVKMQYPGEPVGPLEAWINCRCVIAVGILNRSANNGQEFSMATKTAPTPTIEVTQNGGDPVPADAADAELDPTAPVRWHALLAPEGVRTGDGRMFSEGALSWRQLPLPLSYQPVSSDGGHAGSYIVARIDTIEKDAQGRVWGSGDFANTEMAQEAITMIGGRYLRGVSVDVDDSEMEVTDAAPGAARPEITFSKARIAGATLVAIPAFEEAYIALGDRTDAITASAAEPVFAACDCETGFAAIDEGQWSGDASAYTDEQWFAATLIHTNGDSKMKGDNKLPILTPEGKLSRAGVHAAAARIDQVDASPDLIDNAKAALRSAYGDLQEEVPQAIAASAAELAEEETFAPGTHDGPGWITHPRDTQRLRSYWVHGKGAAKIRWGQPGDFNRCRKELGKYVAPAFLAGTCANLHKVAIKVWPGQEGGGNHHHAVDAVRASAITLVAGAGHPVPAEFFANPELTEPTQLQVEPNGHVFGHLATWGTCHIGVPGVCTTPPASSSEYAYFHTGVVDTDRGPVNVGHLTMGIGHASIHASAASATAHYDRDDAVVANVVMGEDSIGIWFSGVIADGVDPERLDRFRANGSLSGDWRSVHGQLELVGAVAVGVPGFPIPRTQLAASGEIQTALVASGVVTAQSASEVKMTPENVAAIARTAVEEFRHAEERSARLATIKTKTQGLRELRIKRARSSFATITRED